METNDFSPKSSTFFLFRYDPSWYYSSSDDALYQQVQFCPLYSKSSHDSQEVNVQNYDEWRQSATALDCQLSVEQLALYEQQPPTIEVKSSFSREKMTIFSQPSSMLKPISAATPLICPWCSHHRLKTFLPTDNCWPPLNWELMSSLSSSITCRRMRILSRSKKELFSTF